MTRSTRLAFLLVVALGACDREDPGPSIWQTSECLTCTDWTEMLRCTDGLDNNDDGLTDCQDPSCEGLGCCGLEGAEADDSACSDGCDNDGNGFVDCLDYSCSRGAGVTVCRSPVQGPEDTPETCADGVDNDWNGYIDCKDRSCTTAAAVTYCEGSDATCSDGVDNDGNGFTDCGDYSCSKNTKVTVCK